MSGGGDPEWRGVAPRIVLSVCTIAAIATAPGQTVVVSLFSEPLRSATGLSATGLSTAYLLATLGSAATMTWVGRLSDRLGPARLMGAAALGTAGACALAGSARGPASVVAIFFGLRFFGQGVLMLSSAHTLALWFERRLGTAEGVRGAVTSLGFACVPLVVGSLIGAVGWQSAYAILGGGVAAIVVPGALWIASLDPPDVARAPGSEAIVAGHTLPQALRTPAYWSLASLLVVVASGITALLFHLAAVFEASGWPASARAPALSGLLLGVACATGIGGWLADRIDERGLIAAGAGAFAIALGGLVAAPGLPAAIGALIGCGIGQGLVMSVGGTTLARWFGRAHHGAIRGFTTALSVAGTSAGPVLLSLTRDASGAWSAGLVGFAVLSGGVGLSVALARRPSPPGPSGAGVRGV